jgi:hypothetical protein
MRRKVLGTLALTAMVASGTARADGGQWGPIVGYGTVAVYPNPVVTGFSTDDATLTIQYF